MCKIQKNSYFQTRSERLSIIHIERFHSRGQHLRKFIETKESACIRKDFNSHRTGLGHQHGAIEKLHFRQVDLRILLFFFFSQNRVPASSEVQTQTNCYMYADRSAVSEPRWLPNFVLYKFIAINVIFSRFFHYGTKKETSWD